MVDASHSSHGLFIPCRTFAYSRVYRVILGFRPPAPEHIRGENISTLAVALVLLTSQKQHLRHLTKLELNEQFFQVFESIAGFSTA